DIHTMVKDDVSGVDDQINEVLDDINKVSKEEMVMSILSTQAKQIQALTELMVQHSKVLEVLTASHLAGDRSGKKDKNLTEEVQDANSFQGKPSTKKGCGPQQKNVTKYPTTRGRVTTKPVVETILKKFEKDASRFWPEAPICMDSIPELDLRKLHCKLKKVLRPTYGSEILVDNDHCSGSREVLWTLRPGLELVDDVLNLVVGMVSFSRNDSMWWLPTIFVKIALDPNLHCKATLDYIAAKYMGMVENLVKIYVPIYIERHWYLMIVDMLEGKLVYLDSLKDKDERQRRVKQMVTIAEFLDITLSEDKFYDDKSKSQKSISTFTVYEPCISQQSG
ncbi:hypothetical protein S245_066280, partial [Arachis hypogaea]